MKTLKERVSELTAEARATGSTENICSTMVEIKNSNESFENKVKMIYKLKNSMRVALGKPVEKPFSNYELSKKPY